MPQLAVILPTDGYRAEDFVAAAAKLDADVVVCSDERPALPTKFVQMDFGDVRASAARLAQSYPSIEAVVAADDQGVVIAALAGEALGLAATNPAAAAVTRNKAMLRRALDGTDIVQPEFMVVGPNDDPGDLVGALGLPCVLKPVGLSASRGVIRVDSPDQARAAEEQIRRLLARLGENPSSALLLEAFVPGPEIAVEGVVVDGTLTVLAVFDKPNALDGPVFAESIYVTPSRHHPETISAAEQTAADVIKQLWLREGPVHLEFRLHAGDLWFIELAHRSIGGLCSRALKFGDQSLEELLLRAALRLDFNNRQDHASGVLMLTPDGAGLFQGVSGRDQLSDITGVTGLTTTMAIGEYVAPLPEDGRYLGFVFAEAAAPETVESALRAAGDLLDIVLE